MCTVVVSFTAVTLGDSTGRLAMSSGAGERLTISLETSGTAGAPGAFDRTFGANGRISEAQMNVLSAAFSLVSEDKVLTGTTSLGQVTVHRYTRNGTPDATFGTNGSTTVTLGGSAASYVKRILELSDRSVLVAGHALVVDGGAFRNRAFLFRLLPSGSLDTAFGNTGTVIVPNYGGNSLWTHDLTDIALQSNGDILLLISAWGAAVQFRFLMTRYTPDGTQDGTFGTTGWVEQNFDAFAHPNTMHDLAVLADDSFYVGGHTGNPSHFSIARYDADGGLDNTFGNAGLATTAIGANSSIRKLAVLPDGRILATGVTGGSTVALVRIESDGDVDPTFGTGGVISLAVPDAAPAVGSGLLLLDSDKFLLGIAGSAYSLARFEASGSLDLGFGTAGFAYGGEAPSVIGYTSDPALNSEGRILLQVNAGINRYWP